MTEKNTILSADGTELAYTLEGSGPPLVMVHCVATSRATTPQPTLPQAFAEHFTVATYDRRGTGESADGASAYAVAREIEDLAAVMALVPEDPIVYGFSSGALLSLLAAEAGLPIGRLLLLEPPLQPQPDPEGHLAAEGHRRLAEDARAASDWFDRAIVGVPEEILEQLPEPTASGLRDKRTFVHELTFLPGTPAERFAGVGVPATIVASESTAPEMIASCTELAAALPDASLRLVPGTWHGVDDATLVREAVAAAGVPG